MTKLIIILLSAVFINNYVLSRFLGICPFLGVSKKLDSATGMSLAVIFVMLMATAATYPIQFYLLEPNDLGYLQTIVFILVIAALVQLVEIVLKRFVPSLHKSLGVYLPLITTNCAVLGVTILNVQDGHAEHRAVGGDQRQIHAQALVQRGDIALEHDLHQLDQRGDDENKDDRL